MGKIDSYPEASALTGAETFPITQGGVTKTASVSAVLGAMPQQRTAQFYADHGANVARYPDRLLIGAAADNPADANRDLTPRDWLSTLMATTSIGAYPVWGAQGASIARYGSIGWLTASRTSDAYAYSAMLGYRPSSIGGANWVINDDTSSAPTTTGYAGYDEAWRMQGVNYQPTFGREIEAVNFGGLTVGISTPYHINVGGGTYCLQLGSGGGQTSGTSSASAVATIVRNPSGFQKGYVFKADAIDGTDGTAGNNGFAAVLSMGRGHGLEWYSPDGNVAAILRSLVSAAANGTHIEFQDGGIVFTNSDGKQIFSVTQKTGASVNSLFIQPGLGAQAAGLYVSPDTGGSANLGLYPGSGGEIQTQGPVTTSGATAGVAPAYGWLHINVNGQDCRMPLYSPAQAGG